MSLQAQYRSRLFGKPLKLGLDVTHNTEDYSDEPEGSFSHFHQDDVNGFVVQANWGSDGQAGDWLFSYFYANQEALSTNSSYIQDEWVRWGGSGQTRATNLRGSEFRVRYTISESMNVIARLFLVDAVDLLEPGDIEKESANRFRVDFNVRF